MSDEFKLLTEFYIIRHMAKTDIPNEKDTMMTLQKVCTLDDIIPETGVCALVDGRQVAIFRTKNNSDKDEALFAIDNFDPFSHANVLSRGLIGGTVVTDEAGVTKDVLYVASPIYKQRFDLATGQCLDDATVKLNSYEVCVQGDAVLVGAVIDKGSESEIVGVSSTTVEEVA